MRLALLYDAPLPDSTPLGAIASGEPRVKPGAPVGPTELALRVDFNCGDIDFDEESNLLARTFQVSQDVTIVPEPSNWIMLLLGFAGIGLISRRRLGRKPAERTRIATV